MQNTFKEKVVIVTGGANGIGKCIANEFRATGASVYVIDKQAGEHFVIKVSISSLERERHCPFAFGWWRGNTWTGRNTVRNRS